MVKRKAASQSRTAARQPTIEASKLSVNHYNDIADSEDEYLLDRDQILLDEGPEAKRRRKVAEDEALLEASDEEVLDYSNDSDDDEDDLDDSIRGTALQKRGEQLDSEDEDDVDKGGEPQDEYGDWEGDYYGADDVETEEAALAEETEARRLQQKQLQRISAADFGFDEQEWATKGGEEGQEKSKTVIELLPELDIPDDIGPEERLKLLRTRYPEFEPIRREFAELQTEREGTLREAEKAQKLLRLRHVNGVRADASASHPAILRHQALSAYLGVMVMYFAVLASTATRESRNTAMAPLRLREHPVMESLLKTRSLWHKMRDLEAPDVEDEIAALRDKSKPPAVSSTTALLNGSASLDVKDTASTKVRSTKSTKISKAERKAVLLQQESSARRAQRMADLETDFADLSSKRDIQLPRKSKIKPSNGKQDDDADLGDAAILLPHELADKAERRKTLQFYTSQIAQKANKRGVAGRDAGGDVDLPHRERWKEKQARLNAEAERRAGVGHNTDEPDQPIAQKQARPAIHDEDEDYYQTITNKHSAKKAAKTAAAQAHAEAQRIGGRVVEQETIGADGKRAITYAIEKNKGLTPHRKKENRNPRVKKRMKFEERKKKLGSVRAVYKGGEGRGGYGGELTGIKSGLVKSVKL